MPHLLVLAILAAGCAHVSTLSPTTFGESATKIETRNNAASLLADLLNDEQNVDKVLVVKSARNDVTRLITLIAATAAAHNRELSELATNDPTLNLGATWLPPGEKAARDATAKSQEHELLLATGQKFEFNLLFSQAQAENYGWHLAEVAAKNSTDTNQIRTFTNISHAMKMLYSRAVTEMFEVPAG